MARRIKPLFFAYRKLGRNGLTEKELRHIIRYLHLILNCRNSSYPEAVILGSVKGWRGTKGAVAQLGERSVRNAKVVGSIPIGSTILYYQNYPRYRQIFSREVVFLKLATHYSVRDLGCVCLGYKQRSKCANCNDLDETASRNRIPYRKHPMRYLFDKLVAPKFFYIGA